LFRYHFSARDVSNNFLTHQCEQFYISVVQFVVFVAPESAGTQTAGSRPGGALAALRIQIHDDLRAQHPEWIEPNGECPECDFYEARLAELLESYARASSDDSAVAVHRVIQEAVAANKLPAA
jgi:hypothetical protein